MLKTMLRKSNSACFGKQLALTAIFVLGTPLASAQQMQRVASESIASYVNEIGFLRAAPQLIARAYLQMSLSVEPKRASDALAIAAKGASDGVGLARQVLGSDREGQAALSDYQRDLEALKAAIADAIDRKRAKEVSDLADRLTLNAQKIVDLTLARLSSDTTRAVFSAGAQRAISLRLAKMELLAATGVSVDGKDVSALQKAFNENLSFLLTSSLSTQRIKAELDLVRTQWMFMEKALSGDVRGPQAQRDMVIASDNVLRTANELTNMYEQELIKSYSTNRPSLASGRVS